MKKIIVVLLVITLASCDLLTTRGPEQPNTPGNSNIPATSPDILFNNFISSIQDKILENYLACFVDPSFTNRKYKFIAAAGLVSQYPVLIDWNLESEKQYFTTMKSKSKDGQSITLSLIGNGNNTQLGDSAVYQYDYSLSFLANDLAVSGEYQGSVQFKIYLENNLWVIGEWYDLRKNNFSSWSELKGKLY